MQNKQDVFNFNNIWKKHDKYPRLLSQFEIKFSSDKQTTTTKRIGLILNDFIYFKRDAPYSDVIYGDKLFGINQQNIMVIFMQ
ncbi:hypothetical protein DERP_009081 [Dermatophagoides pteronyssinus]|uniref:Uncharacterized protein n=1 Tax=Dermatophagoides pteronyssinus TaxID=6956 RepID=A0ABQ8JH75_DERPT|nr:hypothetical protein DERP_009081 [Dermatophagoides pteronyssinus]